MNCLAFIRHYHALNPPRFQTNHCGISQSRGPYLMTVTKQLVYLSLGWRGGTNGIVGTPSVLQWGYPVTSQLVVHPKSLQLRAGHPAGLEIMLAPTRLHHPGGHNVNAAMSVLGLQILLQVTQSGIWIEASVSGCAGVHVRAAVYS